MVCILLPLPSWDVNDGSGTEELTACYWTRRTIITSVLTNPLRGAVLNRVSPIIALLFHHPIYVIITFHLLIISFCQAVSSISNFPIGWNLPVFLISSLCRHYSVHLDVISLNISCRIKLPIFPLCCFLQSLTICLFRYEYYLRRPNLALRQSDNSDRVPVRA